MSYTPWSTVVVGQVATAVWANQYIGDNISYLHGDAGSIYLDNNIGLPNGDGLYIKDSGGTDRAAVVAFNGGLVIGETGLVSLALSGPNGLVKANGYPILRHSYSGTDQRMEANFTSWAAAPGSSVSVAFTVPYTGTPAVVVDLERAYNGDPGYANKYGVTTTGFTAWAQGVSTGSSWRIHWHAMGG